MKIILKVIITTIFIKNMFFQHLIAKEHKIPSLKQSVPILEKIAKNAITIEGGGNIIYVFVDPFCKYSKKFIKKTLEDKAHLRSSYTYKIFLLKLKKFDSLKTIKYILSSKDKLKELKHIMIDGFKIPEDFTNNDNKINDIIKETKMIGKKLDIYKRPYIIVVNKDWEKSYEDDFEGEWE